MKYQHTIDTINIELQRNELDIAPFLFSEIRDKTRKASNEAFLCEEFEEEKKQNY
jgi:hypothetical protein